MTTAIDYRPLGDHETILPGDVWASVAGIPFNVSNHDEWAYFTPAEVRAARGWPQWTWRRPAPAEPSHFAAPVRTGKLMVLPDGMTITPAEPEPTSDTDPVFRPVDIITIAYDILPGGALVLPSDMVTLDGVKMEPAPHSLVGQRVDRAKHFGVRAVMRRRDEPPQPEPAIDPGDGWRLLGGDEVLEPGDECPNVPGEWVPTIFAGRRVGDAADCPYRRRTTPPPLTPDDIRRAAITEAARDDVLPAMRFGVNCVDGVRRYAASYGEACRVFDEAARATLAKRGGQS